MATPPNRQQNSAAWDPAQSAELLEYTERLIQLAMQDGADEREYINTLCASVAQLREALMSREEQLGLLTQRSEALAQAQADAIIHSVEIIDELESTKQSLSDARAAAEQAAQDTQRLADTVFERTHDGVLIFQNNSCVACNDNALALLDTTRAEILGGTPQLFLTSTLEDGSSAAEALQALCCLGDASTGSLEAKLHPTGREAFWAEFCSSQFRMKEAGHVLLAVRDITARKNFETELRRHRDFLHNIINAVPDPLSVKSIDRTLVLANDAYCDSLNIQRDRVLGQNTNELLPTNLAEHIHSIEERLLATGECSILEYELPDAKRGGNAVFSSKRSLFNDHWSGDQFIVETARDITEDRIREDRLRLLASVFNGSSEGVAILSSDGNIREANPSFLSMSLNSSDSVIGRRLNEALCFGLADFASVLKQVEGGTSWSGKATATTSRGKQLSYWVSLSPSAERDDLSGRIIALVSDITELEATQAKLRRQAMYDNLTGLPNRRYFRDHLDQLLRNGKATEEVTICFLDLDDFKHVNDSAGHSTGDFLLQSVGRRIEQVVPEAFVARFGGDEFAILLTAEQLRDRSLDATLEDLLSAFREPFKLENTEAVVGLSIGVTCYPKHSRNVDALMCNADIAMYAAKAAGKNRIRVFTTNMQNDVNMRHKVQTKLRRALDADEFSLCYQPKVDAKSGEPVGCEALVRWRNAQGDYLPPSDFIPIAEQTGLILPLGELVFQLAAEQACKWDAKGIPPSVAVNISPHQLRHPRFVEQLEHILQQTGARAEWLELEITENAMMDDVVLAVSVIENLSRKGFRVAIDDFGTGYSSLSYIKSFPIHTLKIDLSFVRDVAHDRQSKAIVQSIASLGNGLGLNVVAEGVETQEQSDVLSAIGCDLLQGYHIGRPMSPGDFEGWLRKKRIELETRNSARPVRTPDSLQTSEDE